jgi:hypothetical protein
LLGRNAGWLDVAAGRVWITRDGGGADHVLDAGDRLWLGRGERVLAEPWRASQPASLGWSSALPVLQAPRLRGAGVFGAAPALRAAAVLLRFGAARLLAAARSAEASASRAQGSIAAGDSIASSGALQ